MRYSEIRRRGLQKPKPKQKPESKPNPKPKPKTKPNPKPKPKPKNESSKPKPKAKRVIVDLNHFMKAIINQDIPYLEEIVKVFGTEFLITCNYKVQDVLYLKLTPLLIAIFNNSIEVVKWLINEKKAKINTVYGLALMTAIWKDNLDIVDFLLEKKARLYPKSVVIVKDTETNEDQIDYQCVENKNLDLLTLISKCVHDPVIVQLIVSQMSFGINSQIKRNPIYTDTQEGLIEGKELELEQWLKYFEICIKNKSCVLMSVLLRQLKLRFGNVDEKWMNKICRIAIDRRISHMVLLLLPEGADPSIITHSDRIKLGWSSWKYQKNTITPIPLCLISHEDIEDGEEYVVCPNGHHFKFTMWKEWSDLGKNKCPYCRQNFYPSVIYTQ